MKTTLGILLGVMLAGIGSAQVRKQGVEAKPNPKSHAEQVACTAAKSAFVEKFAQVVSTFHDQVELAAVTPRIALAQRVADLQKTALELKNTALPACAVASGRAAIVIDREATVLVMDLMIEYEATFNTTGSTPETLKKAVQNLQTSDDEIEAICRGLSTKKATDLRLQVWKSDANAAAKFEIKRFLTFMKHASAEEGSSEAKAAAVEGALYSVTAGEFWRTKSDGKH